MAAQVEASVAAPVLEVWVFRLPTVVGTLCVLGGGEARLSDEGRQQTVCVVLHQQFDVRVHGRLHGSVRQRHLLHVEVLRVEQALRRCCQCRQGRDGCQ